MAWFSFGNEGKGQGGREGGVVGQGQAKEPASQCTCVLPKLPLSKRPFNFSPTGLGPPLKIPDGRTRRLSRETADELSSQKKTKGVSEQMVFKMAIFVKLRHFVTPPLCYLFGCLFSSTQKGINTDGFQNGEFFEFSKLGIMSEIGIGGVKTY